MEFLGFARASGFVDLTISPQGLQLLFAVSFNLGGLVFEAKGGAAIVTGADPGFVLSLQVRAVADVSVFYIEASGLLEVNTTNTTRLGVTAHSFTLDLRGKVEILKVLKLDTSLRVEVRGNEWSFRATADIDFFGIVRLSGSVFVDSKGNFDINLRGTMLLGSESFGLKGEFYFRVRSEVIADAIGNPYFIFELAGGASVKVKVFGITLAGVGLDFSFHAEGNGSVPIDLSVTVKIDLGLFSIKKTAKFKIGVLELPKPVFLGGRPGSTMAPARDWDPNVGGQLVLNVGSRGQFRNIATDDDSEPFSVEQLGLNQNKALIKVTAFGRSNLFDNVTNIVADFGGGDDSIRILSGVTIPVTIHGGADQDVIIFQGSGAAQLFGDAGSDFIEASGPGTVVIRGGDETSTPTDVQGDFIVHSGGGFAVIDGGNGDDRILGGSRQDILIGNGGSDDITGPADQIYGDFAPAAVNAAHGLSNSGSAGNDLITLTFEDTDAVVVGGGHTAGQGDTLQLFGRDEGDLVEVKRPASGPDQLHVVIARASDPSATVTLPVYGIEVPLRDPRGGPWGNLERLGQFLVDALLVAEPKGPYLLGGTHLEGRRRPHRERDARDRRGHRRQEVQPRGPQRLRVRRRRRRLRVDRRREHRRSVRPPRRRRGYDRVLHAGGRGPQHEHDELRSGHQPERARGR